MFPPSRKMPLPMLPLSIPPWFLQLCSPPLPPFVKIPKTFFSPFEREGGGHYASQASFKKPTFHENWTIKVGMKVKDLARVEVTWSKFGTDHVMMTSQASFKKPTSCKIWTIKVGRKVEDLARVGVT